MTGQCIAEKRLCEYCAMQGNFQPNKSWTG